MSDITTGTWQLDPTHTEVGFTVRHLMSKVRGKFESFEGTLVTADDITGGTVTITNVGSTGSAFLLPIINQPQVMILSTDGVARRPVVVADSSGAESIAIHSVGILALAWDHRAFDGAYAAAFLAALRDIIETRDWSVEVQ